MGAELHNMPGRPHSTPPDQSKVSNMVVDGAFVLPIQEKSVGQPVSGNSNNVRVYIGSK